MRYLGDGPKSKHDLCLFHIHLMQYFRCTYSLTATCQVRSDVEPSTCDAMSLLKVETGSISDFRFSDWGCSACLENWAEAGQCSYVLVSGRGSRLTLVDAVCVSLSVLQGGAFPAVQSRPEGRCDLPGLKCWEASACHNPSENHLLYFRTLEGLLDGRCWGAVEKSNCWKVGCIDKNRKHREEGTQEVLESHLV